MLMSSRPGPVNAFGANLKSLITGNRLKRKQNAVFLDSSSHHCSTWDLIKIDGDVVRVALWRWWNNTVCGNSFIVCTPLTACTNTRYLCSQVVGKPTKQLWKEGKALPCAACCKPN